MRLVTQNYGLVSFDLVIGVIGETIDFACICCQVFSCIGIGIARLRSLCFHYFETNCSLSYSLSNIVCLILWSNTIIVNTLCGQGGIIINCNLVWSEVRTCKQGPVPNLSSEVFWIDHTRSGVRCSLNSRATVMVWCTTKICLISESFRTCI